MRARLRRLEPHMHTRPERRGAIGLAATICGSVARRHRAVSDCTTHASQLSPGGHLPDAKNNVVVHISPQRHCECRHAQMLFIPIPFRGQSASPKKGADAR